MFKRGTIVLVPFPFTDLSGSKVRPALIISEGKVGNDVMVVFVTSQKKTGKHLVSVQPDVQNGLKANSQIVCAKIATLDTKVVLGEVGTVSLSIQKQVDVELKHILGLNDLVK